MRQTVPVEEQLGLLPFRIGELAGFHIGGVMAGVIQKKLVSGPTLKAAATAMVAKAAVDLLKKQISAAVERDNSQLSGRPAAGSGVRMQPDPNVQPSRSSTSAY